MTSCKNEFIDHYIENVRYKMGLKFLTQVSVNFVDEGDEAVSFYDNDDCVILFMTIG